MGKRIAENFVGLIFFKGPCQKYVSCLKIVALSNLETEAVICNYYHV